VRHSALVELTTNEVRDEQVEMVLALCGANQVGAEFDPASSRLRLVGRQDALGSWARHGRHLARALLEVLDRGRGSVSEGVAQLTLRGRAGRLRLGPEMLDLLAGPTASTVAWEPDDLSRTLRAASTTLRGWSWRVRVQPDPYVCAEGLALPDLLVQSAADALAYLLVAVRGPVHAGRLASTSRVATTGEPLLYVGRDIHLRELRAIGARVVAIPSAHAVLPPPLELARYVRDALLEDTARAA
jgi:hypothetical protein